jgi:hypothetical protein
LLLQFRHFVPPIGFDEFGAGEFFRTAARATRPPKGRLRDQAVDLFEDGDWLSGPAKRGNELDQKPENLWLNPLPELSAFLTMQGRQLGAFDNHGNFAATAAMPIEPH